MSTSLNGDEPFEFTQEQVTLWLAVLLTAAPDMLLAVICCLRKMLLASNMLLAKDAVGQ